MVYMWKLLIKRNDTVAFNKAVSHLRNDACLIEDILDEVVQNLRKTITFYVHKELEVLNINTNEYSDCILKYPVEISIYDSPTLNKVHKVFSDLLDEICENLPKDFSYQVVEIPKEN